MKAYRSSKWSFLFPERCVLCGEVVERDCFLCENCMQPCAELEMPTTPDACEAAHRLHRLAVFSYDGLVKQALHAYKFSAQKYRGRAFAYLLYTHIRIKYADVGLEAVVHVPMNPANRKKRPYDQALVLASHLSALLEIPCLRGVLLRREHGRSQHTLGAGLRQENSRRSLVMGDAALVQNKTVLLVDDVITTGATINRCRELLLQHGAKEVYAAGVARVVRR